MRGCHIFDVTGLMKIGKLFLFPLKTDVQNVQRARDRFHPGAIFSNRENYFIVFEASLQNECYHCQSQLLYSFEMLGKKIQKEASGMLLDP